MTKICGDCKLSKSTDDFDVRSDRKNTIRSYCKACRKLRTKKYDAEHEDERCQYQARYYNINQIELSKQSKQYRDNVKTIHGVSYNTLRKRSDINFKLRNNLRKRLSSFVKGKKSALDCGCSIEELKKHLEAKFKPDMTWDNWGPLWEVDHIKPLVSFDLTKDSEMIEACHYSNLQPLYKVLNRKKGKKYVI